MSEREAVAKADTLAGDRVTRWHVLALAEDLARMTRTGAETDHPEGARVVTVSDTRMREIEGVLRRVAERWPA